MSLKRIVLRDFVIVRELELNLSSGFCVLTGETGAGKSILVDALQLALGARSDAAVVRETAQRADITAEFDLPAHLLPWVRDCGFEEGETLLLRRSIDAQGKSRAWVNGTPATAAQLREAGEQLVDIHGQHAWQSLTRADAVRALLDAYAGVSSSATQHAWHTWRATAKALTQARSSLDTSQRERERLAWQIGELEKLAPGNDEWNALNADHTRLAHAQSLMDAAQSALEALEAEQTGAVARLAHAISVLQNEEHLEPAYGGLKELLASSLAQAQDAGHSLHAYLRKAHLDPLRLAQLDERLSLWMSLARRYKRVPAELPALLAGWRHELLQLDSNTDLAALEAAQSSAERTYLETAKVLSQARAKAAPLLAKAITHAMQGLGMQGGRFEVRLQKALQPSLHGLEEIQFLVAGHSGSTPRPVDKVASGGELSRIALAIAVTTSQLGNAQTLIFDEVDAGVGGAVAETVGRLMKQLGSDRQVLAVTHLPQVASCADHHLVVAKQGDATGAFSTVQPVTGELRVAEIARMLGGERLSGTTMAHAKEMLGGAAATRNMGQ